MAVAPEELVSPAGFEIVHSGELPEANISVSRLIKANARSDNHVMNLVFDVQFLNVMECASA